MAFPGFYDRRVADLITHAQSYSNPTDSLPTPSPPAARSSGKTQPSEDSDRDLGRIDRIPPPDWFNPPKSPKSDPTDRAESSIEVPQIDEEIEVPPISDVDEREVHQQGLDALAYYAPFHFYSPGRWGVYIRDYGIAFLASKFLGRQNLTPSDNWALRYSYWLLYEHEYFHFQTEIAATQYEIATRDQSLYSEAFNDSRMRWLEESVANAKSLSRLNQIDDAVLNRQRINSYLSFAANWMKSQPQGYRDFDRWAWDRRNRLHAGRVALALRMHQIRCLKCTDLKFINSNAFRPYEGAEYKRIPIIRVEDSRIPWLKSARLFPKYNGLQVLVHTLEHPPPHIHVEFEDAKRTRIQWSNDWSDFVPVKNNPSLTGREKKGLRLYLEKFGAEVRAKVKRAFRDYLSTHNVAVR